MSINDSENCTLRKTKITFAFYAIVFRWLFARPDKTNARELELDKLVLPSNEQWRQKVYYNLVELQRGTDPETMKKKIMEHDDEAREIFKWQWDPRGKLALVLSHKQKAQIGCGRFVNYEKCEPDWTMHDVILAARVLEGDPPGAYANECEMRRVFALVYDILRFQRVLSKALDDINFYQKYENIKKWEKIVMLLFYDMQARKTTGLDKLMMENEKQEALNQAGYSEIAEALTKSKIPLNASLARLRVQGQALQLDELLPKHLRVTSHVTNSSGWVNTRKIPNQRDFINEMTKLGFSVCLECPITDLDEDLYNFDPLCPKVVNFHAKAREKLAVSDLVQNFCFVFLDRSLCFGAAALYHAIQVEGFRGPVVLTHSVAPRHVGYLSNLLADVENAGKLLVFGAGNKRRVYENYLRNLGITLQQCQIFSERYVSSPRTPELERSTVVLATPPSSNSGMSDIIDLVMAKDGDVNVLESLTRSDKLEDPVDLIAEQSETLKYALQQPNVQLLIYEVYSILPSETTKVVEEAVSHTNDMTTEKHIRFSLSKSRRKTKDKELEKIDEQKEMNEFDLEHYPDVKIPDCDLFEVGTIADIYKNQNVMSLVCKGSFLAVLKRKEMMQFNSIFMIKYAEAKGLFGNQDRSAENQQLSTLKRPSKVRRASGRKSSINFSRISSDTQNSLAKKRRKSEIPKFVGEPSEKDETKKRKSRASKQADEILTRPKRKSVQESETTRKRARKSSEYTGMQGTSNKKNEK